VTDSPDKLTTDPPLPPGTPDVDELVGDPVPADARARPRTEPDDEDVTGEHVTDEHVTDEDDVPGEDEASDAVSVEPPD
jgi:hypothetical protein